ncbi:RAMP superfamily CRISPR-associated protein [Desulfosoma sp.]
MNANLAQQNIAGGIRSMVARWVITGEMRLETAAHFGGEAKTAVDMTVLRDPRDGTPLLPGTSLAGALRSHLADVLGGYRSSESKHGAALFGGARGDDAGSQSPLIVFDALAQLPEHLTLEIRDGVAIDPTTGTAEPHKKFDFEVLPAGTRFPLRVELIIEESQREAFLLGLLMTALSGLAEGEIFLGMRRSRGLGAVRVHQWKALRHDLTTSQGWLGWLTSHHEEPIGNGIPSYASVADAIRRVCPCGEALDSFLNTIRDKRRRMEVELDLEIAGDLLVRSPATDPRAPDAVHLCSAGKPILPGTGFAGALRTQALRIARLVRQVQGDGELWIERLFGPRLEEEDQNSQKGPAASKLRITESFIANGLPRRHTRIAIDRFTGGVVKGALFEEEVQAGGRCALRLELRNPSDAEMGLMLLLLKDVLSGEIPVGGTVSIGRGLLGGTAWVQLPDRQGNFHIAKDLTVEEEARKVFDEKIKAFHTAEPLTAQGEETS